MLNILLIIGAIALGVMFIAVVLERILEAVSWKKNDGWYAEGCPSSVEYIQFVSAMILAAVLAIFVVVLIGGVAL